MNNLPAGRKTALITTTLLAMALSACASHQGAGNLAAREAADAVYTNGKVVTVDSDFAVAQAFAVKGGKFLAVGSSADMQRYVGANTQIINLQGKTVIPGLGDGHLHAPGGGPGIDLSQARSLADLFAKISEAAANAKPGDVLVSNMDWHEAQLKEVRTPTQAELEKAAPGIPLVLIRGGHTYFLNSTALAKWNITPDTPVPQGGAVPKDANGDLTGEVTGTAKALVKLPPPPPTSPETIQAEQRTLNSYGLTSVRIPGTSAEAYRQYQAVSDAGNASVRYSVLFWGHENSPDSLRAAGIKQDDGDPWVRVWGIKLGVDGGFEGGLMSQPYAEPMGRQGTYFGLDRAPQEAFNKQVVAWNDAGWRVATHAVGDAGIDKVLEAYETANADKDIRSKGWTIEHAFISRPDQYPRMKALDLRLSVQDHLYLAAPVLKKYWGAQRSSQVTPLNTYLDLGLVVAGGTDAPVIPVNPFWVMYHFVTRDTMTDGVYGKDQAVSREEALRLITIDYAKLTDEEDIKGSIEPDKLADFVVLSADLLTIPEDQIEDLKALATFVDGKKVYEDENAGL